MPILTDIPRPPQRFAATDPNGSSPSSFVIVTGNASANTKGAAWEQLIASTPFDAKGFILSMRNANSGPVDHLVDIAVGAAAGETIIIPNIAFCQGVTFGVTDVYVPFGIPAGSRISAKVQGSTGSKGIHTGVNLIAGDPTQSFQRAENWGANTADSGGISIDPGGTVDTEGAYAQLVASTVINARWLLVCMGNRANAAETTAAYYLDIAVGGAGSEVNVILNLSFIVDTATDGPNWTILSLPCSIPAGSRVSARLQSSTNDATDRLKDITIVALG